MPTFAKHLRTWGEAGTVKTKTNTTPKVQDRGITCMMAGYSKDHGGNCYDMLNWETSRIIQTRDVIWLKRMYYTMPVETDILDKDVTDKEPKEPVKESNQSEASEPGGAAPAMPTTRSGRTVVPPNQLIDEQSQAIEIQAVGAGIGGGFTHTSKLVPMKYDEAMAKDPTGWGKAVTEEYQRMKDHKVFKEVPLLEVPKGSKILSSTWAMKLKANGTKRASR